MDRRHCCLHTRLLVNYYFEFANGPGKLDRPMDKNLVVFCLAVQKTGGKGPHCDKIAIAAIAGRRFIWSRAFVEVARTFGHFVLHCGMDNLDEND